MQIIYKLDIDLFGEKTKSKDREIFMKKFKKYHEGPTLVRFCFEDESGLKSAVDFLEEKKIGFLHIYSFRQKLDEVKKYPAFSLPFTSLYDVIIDGKLNKKFKNKDAVKDYHSDKVLISKQVKDIIKSNSIEVSFQEFDGLNILNVKKALLDHLFFPEAYEVDANVGKYKGTYTIISDGRSVISKRDVNFIKKYGMVIAEKARVDSKILKLYPKRFLVSGKLMFELLKSKVKGYSLGKLFPLLVEDDPIVMQELFQV